MKSLIYCILLLPLVSISCKQKKVHNRLFYEEAIGDRDKGPLKNAIEIDEYLSLYEHLSTKFLHCRDYKIVGDCQDELHYEQNLSENEKKRLWLYNLQKAQAIIFDENTPQDIRLSAKTNLISSHLEEAEKAAAPLVKKEKDAFFQILIEYF